MSEDTTQKRCRFPFDTGPDKNGQDAVLANQPLQQCLASGRPTTRNLP
jgi:hypothetical protein